MVILDLLSSILPALNKFKDLDEEKAAVEEQDEIAAQKLEEKQKALKLEFSKALFGFAKEVNPGTRKSLGRALTQLAATPDPKSLKAIGRPTDETPVKISRPDLPFINIKDKDTVDSLISVTQHATPGTDLLGKSSFVPDPKKMIPLSAFKEVIREENWRKIKIINTNAQGEKKPTA